MGTQRNEWLMFTPLSWALSPPVLEEGCYSFKSWFLWEPVANYNWFICLLSWNVRKWKENPQYLGIRTLLLRVGSPLSRSPSQTERCFLWFSLCIQMPPLSLELHWAQAGGPDWRETASSQYVWERRDKIAAPWVLPAADTAFSRESKVSEHIPSYWSQDTVLSHRWNGIPHFYTPFWTLHLTCPVFFVLIHVRPASKGKLHFPWLTELKFIMIFIILFFKYVSACDWSKLSLQYWNNAKTSMVCKLNANIV